jgi:hypothetical protein
MKVIDLLNKIAKGEEVPKKIKYEEKEWIYRKNVQDYIYEKDIEIKYLIQEILKGYIATKDLLFYEIEIIEEDKGIEKLELGYPEDNPSNVYIINEYGTKCYLNKHDRVMAFKINELIDEVNRMKKED